MRVDGRGRAVNDSSNDDSNKQLTQHPLGLGLGSFQSIPLLLHHLGPVELLRAVGRECLDDFLALLDLGHVAVTANDLLEVLKKALVVGAH